MINKVTNKYCKDCSAKTYAPSSDEHTPPVQNEIFYMKLEICYKELFFFVKNKPRMSEF